MDNAFTADIEDWYHAHDLGIEPECWDNIENRVAYGTERILELLAKCNILGTFFVLGDVAYKQPALVKRIAAEGHEIGSHGNLHRMVDTQSKEDFKKDLLSSKYLLEDLTGQRIQLYRAPSWSISRNSIWALEILEAEGFICDSSIQPFKTPLSGMKGTPTIPFHPVIGNNRLNLVEFPPTVLQFGKLRLPFCGGFYLRALPEDLVKWAFGRINKKRSGLLYVHPWEVDTSQPRLAASMVVRFTHYLNLHKTLGKLEKLLQTLDFVPLGHLIQDGHYPDYPIA